MKMKKIIYGLITFLIICIVIAGDIVISNNITKKEESFDIELTPTVKEWVEIHITNDYWVGNSLQLYNNNNTYTQLYFYQLDGNNNTEKHKLIENYEKESLYCNEMQEMGENGL